MTINNGLAPGPPLGWNSWDCFGASVTEEEVLAVADAMANRLAPLGYRYIVIDAGWYFDEVQYGESDDQEARPNKSPLLLDGNGRLVPSAVRFPSAKDGAGFRELSRLIRKRDLKLGLHLMRGIPREAVARNLPIVGTDAGARDIADMKDTCPWSDLCYGVDMDAPAGQAYYDSVMGLCADWEIDFIKYDDIFAPYHAREIDAVREAIDKSGREIMLSLSPGNQPDAACIAHARARAEMFRITGDIWDEWSGIAVNLERLPEWAPLSRPGAWADADMLPLGRIGIRHHPSRAPDRMSRLSREEQQTLMSLWCIARSPLMMGGYLPDNDGDTWSLLTNPEPLAVNQQGRNPRQLLREGPAVAWVSEDAANGAINLALFNAGDHGAVEVQVSLDQLGIGGNARLRDLWRRKDLGAAESGVIRQSLDAHASCLLRVTPSAPTDTKTA